MTETGPGRPLEEGQHRAWDQWMRGIGWLNRRGLWWWITIVVLALATAAVIGVVAGWDFAELFD